jgi:NifU-like protein involved in Fe-S cluster formation
MVINKTDIEERQNLIQEIMLGIKSGNIKNNNSSEDLLCLNQITNYPSRINCALLPWQSAQELITRI